MTRRRRRSRTPPRAREELRGSSVPFPFHPGKHRHRPLVTAAAFHRYAATATGRPPPKVPRTVILVFGRRWRKYLDRKYPGRCHPVADVYRVAPRLGVTVLDGPGAPFAAIAVEELSALGTTRFLIVGLAGSLTPGLRVSSRVLCTQALRDEGTSRHYAPPTPFAFPSRRFVSELRTALDRAGASYAVGPSWTTDAPYRETAPEVRRYRRAGILTVEMEAAAVFSVARSLHRQAAALFVISDHLDEGGWEPRFHDSRESLERLLDLAIRALRGRTRRAARSRSRARPAR